MCLCQASSYPRDLDETLNCLSMFCRETHTDNFDNQQIQVILGELGVLANNCGMLGDGKNSEIFEKMSHECGHSELIISDGLTNVLPSKYDIDYSVKTFNDSFLLSGSGFDWIPKQFPVKGTFSPEKI